MHAQAEALLIRLTGEPPHDLRVRARALAGGLEAAGVHLVSARYRDAHGRQRLVNYVVKHLRGEPAREAGVYRDLVCRHAPELGPRVLDIELTPAGATLYLEAVRRQCAWPWNDLGCCRSVLQGLARLHRCEASAMDIPAWDYEAALVRSAADTLELMEANRARPYVPGLARSLRVTRRLLLSLPRLRRQLLGFSPFGTSLVHGDVHSGNAAIRRTRRKHHAVLLDWGRARHGSPLEDVASWLQSLRCWEPRAGQRHDTLFSSYLGAFGAATTLSADVRGAYWIAAASNVLAGALRYHVAVAHDPGTGPARRQEAIGAAIDCTRVLVRADAYSR